MDSIRINISTVYFSVCLLMIVLGTQHGVFGAIEQVDYHIFPMHSTFFFYIVVFVILNVSQFLTKSRFSLSPIVFSALHWPILFYRSIICQEIYMKFYANAFRLKFSPILLFLKATVSFPHLIDTTMRRYKTLMSIWWSDGGDNFEQNYEEFFYCTRRNALFL